MKTKTFWISYDLGIRGDYPGLYAWLDSLGAQECGDSVAFFKKKINETGFIKSLTTEVNKHVKLNKTDRIYLIYKDEASGNVKGKFLAGGRKRAPWEGYGISVQEHREDF